MKSEQSARRSFIGRYNRAKREAAELASLLHGDAADMTDHDIGAARSVLDSLVQCFHEMNAYRNVLLTD